MGCDIKESFSSARSASAAHTARAKGHSGMTVKNIGQLMNNKAFTLIELLVAVLIIGILAAIAVPKYQKALAKVRVARWIPLGYAITNAQNRYFLANGKFATDFNALDITLPNDCTAETHLDWAAVIHITCKDKPGRSGFINWSYHAVDQTWTEIYFLKNGKLTTSGTQAFTYMIPSSQAKKRLYLATTRPFCRVYTDAGRAICQALGGKLISEGGTPGEVWEL